MADFKDDAKQVAGEIISKSGLQSSIAVIFICLALFLTYVIGSTFVSTVNSDILSNSARIADNANDIKRLRNANACIEYRHARTHPENDGCSAR